MLPRYFFEFGSFYFRTTPTNILFMCQEVSILFDGELGTVLKHGPKANISAYMKDPKYVQLIASGMFNKMQVVTFYACEEAATWINDTLSSSGSILVRLKQLQEIATPYEGYQPIR